MAGIVFGFILLAEAERKEIRQICLQKGFSGDNLDQIVSVITSSRELWVETMLTEELGLQLDGPDPLRAGLTTFGAFLVVGLIPLLWAHGWAKRSASGSRTSV